MTTDLILGDGGIETDLIFHHGQDLPHFAAFVLLDTEEGRERLRAYYRPYLDLARESGAGLVLETPTWRAGPAWFAALGRPSSDLGPVNRAAVRLLRDLCQEQPGVDVIVSGCLGPRDDGYVAATTMDERAAQDYHRPQVEALHAAGADRVTAMTVAYPAEAVGVVRAAQAAGIESVISFTVETDGRLPDGTSLPQAIQVVDDATERAAAFFMVNCAHPSHVALALDPPARGASMRPDAAPDHADDRTWWSRVQGVRANASTRSHAELDAAEDLDEGDPATFGRDMARLHEQVPSLRVLGGCCGTDERHIRAVAQSVTAQGASRSG
jgi:S-methylmethionine-dependent homocysteine/selenocysteine methylase